jgi:hypothetical protein
VALLAGNRRAGATVVISLWSDMVPIHGARLLTRVRSGAKTGQTDPAPPTGEGVLWRWAPVASVRLHRWIRGDRLRSTPRAARSAQGEPGTVLRTAVDKSGDK